MEGHKLYEYLKENGMLKSCLSLRDGEEKSKRKALLFSGSSSKAKRSFLWKSVVQNRNGFLYVPYLFEDDDEVVVALALARQRLGRHQPRSALRKLALRTSVPWVSETLDTESSVEGFQI
jgi:hypothetical protein